MKYSDIIQHAKRARAKGDYEKSINLYQEAFKQKIMVEDLVDLGLVHLDHKEPLKAISIFTDVISEFPNLAFVHYGLGIAYEEIGKKDEAIRCYKQAISIDESLADAYFSLALLADEANDEKAAYDHYKKTLLYEPDHYWANLNLGSIYEKDNYLELALEHTLNAYRKNPKEKMVAYNLGVISMKLQRFEDAIKYYQEEIEKDGHPLSYLNLGLLYKDIYQDLEKARYYYLAGISKYKDNPDLWFNLACVYALKKDYENTYNCLLYAIIRDRKLLPYLMNDEELNTFRETTYFKKLIDTLG